ncbi:holin family protein [Sulfurimonas sp.]|jgi:hypothetical protein|uniref:holin family protein n=1 Tax=Sulfurimonas sp. TaxID=2022749 RepID=UPI002A35F45E|nr:holin family protein [Sulfurimonas sp.]MDY0124498.1 holin family protein [Sulfurimonas sp.]
MDLLDFFGGGIIDSVGKIADELITSDEERLEKENEILKTKLQYDFQNKELDTKLMTGQIEVNKIEAQHPNIFIAGWRPAVGWIGAIALAYQFIIYPFLIWLWTFLQSQEIIPKEISYPPVLDIGALWTIVSGMLGIGVMRSFDKTKNIDTKKM